MKQKEYKTIGIKLDLQTYKKIKEFSVNNGVSNSEIVRELIKKISLKINVRDNKTIQFDSKEKGKLNKKSATLYLTEELLIKIKKMSLENDTSYSEIIRHLINNTDLSKISFKTRSETLLKAKSKQY